MKKKKCVFREYISILICYVGIMSLGLTGCQKDTTDIQKQIRKTSIFSWEDTYIYPEQESQLSQIMDKLGCTVVYQEIPEEIEGALLKDYLNRRSKNKQDVYYLTGQAEWGLEQKGESMLASVRRVIRWNRKMDKEAGITGIVFDVEPYLLDEWDEDREAVMKQYVDNCIASYKIAKKSDLITILCIPNFYDRVDQSQELERLVEHGCDAIAVMNYNKDDEAGQIADETKIVAKHQKGIIHITEMQKPGVHDLTDHNTYYHDGTAAVRESWEEIKERLDYPHMGFSWHYLKPIQKILEREKSS